MTLRRKSLALGSSAALAGGATGASLLAMLMAATPAGAVGSTYYVDTLADGAANAADCINNIVDSCSLRDALDAAADGDTIEFTSGLSGTIALTHALDVDSGIVLRGPGAANLTLNGGAIDRIFYINQSGSDLTIEGLTITGGSSAAGGGILDNSVADLTLENVVVTGNTSSGNGGGVFSVGSISIIDSLISDNSNATYGGAGVYVLGDLTMSGTVISGNTATTGGGGGVQSFGDVSITTSTFENNVADVAGGGLYTGVSHGTITITDSTFSNNSASGVYGGGIDIDGNYNTVLIANSTISGNSSYRGGGIHIDYANSVMLAQDTIVGNEATNSDALYTGGGIHFADYNVSLELSGAIVSGNTAAAGPADIGFGRPASLMGFFSANNSVLGDLDSRLSVIGANNVSSTAPGVGALTDNGGLTKTMALLPGSAAIDAGPSAIQTFTGNAYDQRGAGFARVVGTRADIGAFEVQPEPPATTTTTAPPATTTTVASDEPVIPAFTG